MLGKIIFILLTNNIKLPKKKVNEEKGTCRQLQIYSHLWDGAKTPLKGGL